MGYLALYYVLAALVFFIKYLRQENPLRRQQLKWLTRGTSLTVHPPHRAGCYPFSDRHYDSQHSGRARKDLP